MGELEVLRSSNICSEGELGMKQRNSDASDSTLVGTPAEKKTTIEFAPSAKKENNYKQGQIIQEWSMFSLARSQASQLTLPTDVHDFDVANQALGDLPRGDAPSHEPGAIEDDGRGEKGLVGECGWPGGCSALTL